MNNDFFDDMFISKPSAYHSKLNDAFKSDDENAINDYLKQFDEKKENELFMILDKITVERDLDFDVSGVNYNKYMINNMLSRSYNCLGLIFILNIIDEGLSNQQHYDFLVRNIPVGRKSYKDRTRQYLEKNALEVLVKILLMHVYKCNERVADDYYDVLVARDKVGEFIHQYRAFLTTPEADSMMKKMIRGADGRREYNNLVHEFLNHKV